MRILVCSNRYFVSGGPERYLFSILKILEDRGHAAIPFAMDFARNEPTPYAKYFVRPPVDRNAVFFSEMKLTRRQKAALLLKTLYNFGARRKIKEAIRAERIDVVYALQVGNYLAPAIFDGARSLGVPVVYRQSDFHLLCPAYHFLREGEVCEECKKGLWHAVKFRCLKGSRSVSAARVLEMCLARMLRANQKIQAFVTPTQFMRRKLIEFGYPPEKIAHIPTPIDAEPIAPQFDGGRYFLYAGNLNPHKGIAVLLEAMRRCPEAQLKIAGQSTEGADLEIQDCIARRGLANVEFLGFRSGAELADLYRNALALVAPALWYENMPNAVLEAMAYGKPIVSSNLGSMPELVEDGLNGRLVPPGDAQALAEAIAALARDPEAAAAMGKASRYKALREHSVESHYARLLALFRSSLGQPIEPEPPSPSESNKP